MRYPKGEVVHQNLSTEYTDIPELLATLSSEGFTGVVEVVLAKETGAFIVMEGKALGALIESEPDQSTTFSQEAMDELIGIASKQAGILNIYKLSPAQVDAIVSRFSAEIVFKGLTTDFVKLDKFIQKLGAEHHTGYIEVFTKKGQPMGTLFLKEGELIDLHLRSGLESPSLSEPKAIPTFLEDVIHQGAVFDVYRSLVTNISSETHGDTKSIGQVIKDEDSPAIIIDGETIQELAEVEQTKEIAGESINSHERLNSNGHKQILAALQEIIARVEKFVDDFSQEGIFLRAFKRALIEKSDTYPFLDPFTEQFDYRHGEITLDEEVELEDFAAGIADCFNLTVSHLKKEFPKNMNLSLNTKTELESKFKLYQEAMMQSGVQSVPPMFFK
ncbi:MAG TPA: DUF2226 domain-containing protein [Syntrophorhabdus sp.]|nr:DUF2226 domain-containing protein [Syntrophorhabdus sp.]HNY71595.1 DUF2226 domain-containing protein [Syntrophorhabdus sp.]